MLPGATYPSCDAATVARCLTFSHKVPLGEVGETQLLPVLVVDGVVQCHAAEAAVRRNGGNFIVTERPLQEQAYLLDHARCILGWKNSRSTLVRMLNLLNVSNSVTKSSQNGSAKN